MAANNQTLAEMVRLNDTRTSGAFVDNLLEMAPVARTIAATVASNGTDHRYLRYTDPPPAGFRAVNDGIAQGHPETTLVSEALQILDASYAVDINLARSASMGESAYIAEQGRLHLRTAFWTLEKQIVGGTVNGAAGGFAGLANQLSALGTYVVDGGGAANLSSVYFIRSVDPMTDTAVVAGNGGNITVSEPFMARIDGSTTGHLNAWAVDVSAYYGLQIGATVTMARFANIDTSGANFNDDDIANVLSLFPEDRPATHIIMNNVVRRILQQSRTATNTTGAPAPFPESAFGVPIIVTRAIGNTETALV